MYKHFVIGNIFGYIEFLALIAFFVYLMWKNFSKIKAIYIKRFTNKIKIPILVIAIFLNGLIYPILWILNINWIISIAINAFMISMIVCLSISVFWGRDK